MPRDSGWRAERKNSDGDDVSRIPEDERHGQGNNEGFLIDFKDNTETLGHIGNNYNTEKVSDDIENNYSEEEWQEMSRNDIGVARNKLIDNNSSIEEIRPYVEEELSNSPDNESDERALMRGIGRGINSESLISNSADSARVLKPLAEELHSEYIGESIFKAWLTGSTILATEGRFAHLPITIAYEENGELVTDYVEPGVPKPPGLGREDRAISRTGDSVYSDPDQPEFLTAYEYSKARKSAEQGLVEQEGRANPMRAIHSELAINSKTMVDSGLNDLNISEVPNDGIMAAVSDEFGESYEQSFDDLDEEKLEYMENVGRAAQLFYENEGWDQILGIGGTLEQPVFAHLNRSQAEAVWNGEVDTIREAEQYGQN